MDDIEAFGDVRNISYPAVRDVHFGMSDVIFAADYAAGELHQLCDYGHLDVRVYDRCPLPEDE
eukprot:839501-Prorocentrum_minimum.AAC.1